MSTIGRKIEQIMHPERGQPGYGGNGAIAPNYGAGAAPAHGVGHTGVAPASGLPGPAPTTAGPHRSNVLNKLDPTVDSDLSNPRSSESMMAAATLPGPAPTTAGPHRFDLLNKLDPSVDSDMSNPTSDESRLAATALQGQVPNTAGPTVMQPGAAAAGHPQGLGQGHHGYAAPVAAGVGAAALAKHEQGRHGHHGYGHGYGNEYGHGAPVPANVGTAAATGRVPEGEYGPHRSRLANALDPRVDSDADHRGAPAPAMRGAMGMPAAGGYATEGGAYGANAPRMANPPVGVDMSQGPHYVGAAPGAAGPPRSGIVN